MEEDQMPARVDAEKCTGCADCVETCPNECIRIEGEIAVVNEDDCTDCAACEDACPSGAIAVA